MTWLANLWNTARAWLVAALAIIAGGALAYIVGRKQGADEVSSDADAAKSAQDATNAATAAQAQAHDAQVRHDVENDTEQLPAASAQPVASADPGSATGQLREEGWTR